MAALPPSVLFIAGTTAVGKTALSIQLAQLIGGEIVSADSVQVYSHMNIGSAKVDDISRANVPHHLLDVVDVTTPFNSHDYCKLAQSAIQDIIERGKVPIIVGGTSFYFNFLLGRVSTCSPRSTNETLAKVGQFLGDDDGDWEKSLAHLKAIDPVYADGLGVNDWFRLKRALDICLQSGRTVTSFKVDKPVELSYSCHCLFLTMPRVQLFRRIDERCEIMLSSGFLEEVVHLVKNHGLTSDSQAGNSIGYHDVLEYLSKEWDFPQSLSHDSHVTEVPLEERRIHFLEFLTNYQACTRQLVRKQLTWFKKDELFHWLNMAPNGELLSVERVAERVKEWMFCKTTLPAEWDGTHLKILSRQCELELKTYLSVRTIYNNDENIDKTLLELMECLKV